MSGIMNSTGAVSGILGTTVAPAVGTGTDGYIFTATGAGVDPAWEAAAAGGITDMHQWRLTVSLAGNVDPIVNDLAEATGLGYGRIGSTMTVSSGVWTFPSTGYWWIVFCADYQGTSSGSSRFNNAMIYTTLNNSSYSQAARGSAGFAISQSSYTYNNCSCSFLFDVTDLTNQKVKFATQVSDTATILIGDGTANRSSFTFMKAGST